MKKSILTLGLILVFAGIISASSSKLPVAKTESKPITDTSQSWEISTQLRKGENVSLLIQYTVDFTELYDGELPANVTFSVNQAKTKFQVFFKMVPRQYYEPLPGTPPAWPLYVFKASLLQANLDCLVVGNPPRQVGGLTQQEGLYTARVLDEGLWWAQYFDEQTQTLKTRPPDKLELVKQETDILYPYTILGPIGATSTVTGTTLSIYGYTAKSTKTKPKQRKARR